MTTYSFVQYDVLKDLVYFKGTPTPGLTDTITENSNDISSIRDIIQNDTTGQLTLLSSAASIAIINFLETTPEINLSNSKNVILKIEIIDSIEVGNVNIVSKNLDGTKTYVTKGGLLIAIGDIIKLPKYPTMGKCKNCLKFSFDPDNNFNFTGNIGGIWDGTWKNNQKVYDVSIPTYATPQSFGVYTNYKIFWKPNVTYSGLDYNGAPINLVNQKRWICVPSSSIGTPTELSNTTFFHVLNDLSASCAYAPPTTTWYNFFGKDGYFLLENTPLPTMQSSTQTQPCPSFSPTPGTVDWGYNCGPNGCVAAPSGSIGTYATIAECQLSCSINYGWNCTSGECVTGSANNPGFYNTLIECQTLCVPDYGWNCTIPNGCVPGTQDNPGIYNTFLQCDTNCPVSYGYNCVNGNCIPGTSINPGTYDTIVECTATCSAVYGYNCTPNGCVLGDDANTGSYTTLIECENNCFYPPILPTYCDCPGPNLVINGNFATTDNWVSTPSTYTPGTGIMLIDPVSGYATAGVNSGVQFNFDNTSSIYLTQANVFNISCSYSVCFQAWANIYPANSANATIILDDGNYPLNTTINSINNLTQTPTAYTINLNNVSTNDLTFYFGFPSGSTAANAEINIDNICVTLLSCPPEEIADCIITGSASTFEIVEYDCLCPEGYISNGSGSCISIENPQTPIILNPAVYPSFPGVLLSPGLSILQPYPTSFTAAVLSNGSIIPPNIGWSQPSLYYQYNLNGQSAASLTNPSPIAGNPNIHKTQYTFDILKSPFWTDPAPAGNPIYNNNGTLSPVGTTNIPPNPLPSYVWDRWLVKRMRTVTWTSNASWFGCGTSITTPTTKTYYVMISAGYEYKMKLNGVTILQTNPNQNYVTNFTPANYPEYQKQFYARIVGNNNTGLGTLPAPFYGLNPYITSFVSGSWGWTNSGAGYTTEAYFQVFNWQGTHKIGLSNISIYPVTFSPGCNSINIEARGLGSCGQRWLAAAIFDNTAAEIANATSINDLNISWDTSYLQNLGSNLLYPEYFYGYAPQSEPSPVSYISVCPTGSTPISGSACNGCLTTGSTYSPTTIPCGSCIECTHGRLYNGYVVDAGGYIFQGRGPIGIVNTGSMNASTWVIPAESDWDTLITYANGGVAPPTITGSLGTTAGGELKDYTRDLNATCWENPNIGAQTATGSSGWVGTAGGKRDNLGTYSGLGFEGIWWSANSSSVFPNPFQLYTRELKHSSSDVYRNIYTKNYGFSLRLVRPAIAGEVNGAVIAGDYTGKDGTLYDSIVIGTQVWIDKNLSETQYNDGSVISFTINSTTWGNAINSPTTPTSCFYDNDPNNVVIPSGNIDPLTGECYTFPSYYIYQKCGTNEYLVQNISGSTITPGEVQKDSNQDCWEFTNIATGLPNYPSQTLFQGNYFSGSNYVYDNCDECNAIHTIYMKFGTKNC